MKSCDYISTIITTAVIFLIFMTFSGASQSTDSQGIINLIIDFDVPESPTSDQLAEAESYFVNMSNELGREPRYYNYTIASVQDANFNDQLFLAAYGLNPRIELAMSGKNSNEKLSAKSYQEQKTILEKSKENVKAAKVCGTNEIAVTGFMPQSFDQNKDTYKVLDEIGILYNLGFQAGNLYEPGHENDVWPYKVENHEFYAVPVSTVTLSGEKVPLDDRYIKDKGISASEWYDMLIGKLDEISGKDEPMVVSLSSSISGKGDYLGAFKKFIAYAESKGAKFAKTQELLEMKGFASPSAASECKACESASKNITSENTTIIV